MLSTCENNCSLIVRMLYSFQVRTKSDLLPKTSTRDLCGALKRILIINPKVKSFQFMLISVCNWMLFTEVLVLSVEICHRYAKAPKFIVNASQIHCGRNHFGTSFEYQFSVLRRAKDRNKCGSG